MNDMNEASLFAWATQVLSACSMSHKEICEVVGANDPEILRRHIELHLEWLEERLADQRRSLARVQRVLFGQIPLDDAASGDAEPRERPYRDRHDAEPGVEFSLPTAPCSCLGRSERAEALGSPAEEVDA